MREDFYTNRILNGIQMYADNICWHKLSPIHFYGFCYQRETKDDSTPFWFLKWRKMKSIRRTIQSGIHLESWGKIFFKRSVNISNHYLKALKRAETSKEDYSNDIRCKHKNLVKYSGAKQVWMSVGHYVKGNKLVKNHIYCFKNTH